MHSLHGFYIPCIKHVIILWIATLYKKLADNFIVAFFNFLKEISRFGATVGCHTADGIFQIMLNIIYPSEYTVFPKERGL